MAARPGHVQPIGSIPDNQLQRREFEASNSFPKARAFVGSVQSVQRKKTTSLVSFTIQLQVKS